MSDVDKTKNRLVALKSLFGFDGFRAGQAEVISQVLDGVDTLALMPTGAGKSLCYQLSAMLLPRTTVIISPLIALMKDQLDSLPKAVRERSTVINSSVDGEEIGQRMQGIAAGQYKLVYAAPERLRQFPFIHTLGRIGVSLCVVDEAHCVSTWGHDFRPDYLFIAKALGALGNPTLLAMTATATPEMRREIATRMGRPMGIVSTGVFRPNLHFSIEAVKNNEEKMRWLFDFCRRTKGSGIVYANSRERCEELARLLRWQGVNAEHYHAGMVAEERARVQNSFMADRTRVIAATIAFGMGIDKPDVRFIVHYNPPKSIESYAQESGRAGRDGQPARCVLLCAAADRGNLTRWTKQEFIKVETLRAVYRAAKVRARGSYALMTLDDLLREVDDEGDGPSETKVKVAVSLLERAGLLVRHFDLPRSMTIRVLEQRSGGDLGAFVDAAHLRPQQALTLDTMDLCAKAGVAPDRFESLLLGWSDEGRLSARGSGRDMLLELPPAPADASRRIQDLLQAYESAQLRRNDDILAYAQSNECRHKHILRHFGERPKGSCDNCDVCVGVKERPIKAPIRRTDGNLWDGLEPQEAILRCVGTLPFPLGKRGIVRVLKGSVASPVKRERCALFGALSELPASRLEKEIDSLVSCGRLLRIEGEYPVLGLAESERKRLLGASVSK